MNRKEIEKYEAAQLRLEINRILEQTSDRELKKIYRAIKNYEKLDEFMNLIRELSK